MENGTMQEQMQPLLASAELRAVADYIRDYAIFLLDSEGTVLTWNTGAQRIKGYEPDHIIGRSFTRFYTDEDRAARLPQHHLEVAAREGRIELEGWRVRKDGSRFWANVVISPIYGDGGEVQGFVKVTRDLTERRRIEEQLREGEERFRLMIESIEDYAVFLLDPQGRVANWNPGAERMKGYPAAEIIGQHLSRFYPPEDATSGKAARELEIAASTGHFEEEGWRVRKDGSRFWASVVLSAVRNRAGELIGFTEITRDMTERKRAAEELAERSRQQFAVSELGLRALQTPELPAVMDAAIRIARDTLHVEDVRLLGPTEPPPPTANTAVIHGPEEKAQAYGVLAAMSERPFSANERSFLEAVANVVAAAIARKRIEEQLRVAERVTTEERGRTEQAEAALRERDEFISVAAHELRTPLTALQLKLQGLERGLAATDPRKVQRLEGAVRQTERLSRLIDRLLDVSRIAQGRLELWPEEFDLVALVREVADDFREPAAQARAPLELELPDKAEGSWDRLRIEQVLVNVLSNAVKYGAGRPVSVKLEVEEDRVRLAVRDQGIGIPAEDASRIFGRFQRAASIRNYGGLGLGLYITRHIVEAHRGTIAVASAVGEGSTFSIDLPRFSLTPAANRNKVRPARA
jgi:PAS domain S-box-containing protein